MASQISSKLLLAEISLARLNELVKKGKIKSVKDLSKYGFYPELLKIEKIDIAS